MKIKIIDWNISFGCDIKKVIEEISQQTKTKTPTIVCLQEVIQSKYESLKTASKKFDISYSLDLRKPGEFEGQNRKLGLCIMAFNCRIIKSDLIYTAMTPERTLFSILEVKNKQIGILNFHSLTGVHYKKAKSSNFRAIASFIKKNEDLIDFICFDANEPQKDYFNINKVVFYDNFDKGQGASMILGKDKVHHLNDAYRSFLDSNQLKPRKEPLVVSHINRGYKKRFDYIFHSDKWKTLDLTYHYEEALKAKSDHAFVVGEFSS